MNRQGAWASGSVFLFLAMAFGLSGRRAGHDLSMQLIVELTTIVGVAVVTGWLIMQKSPPLLAGLPSEAVDRSAQRAETCARWFATMRWIAVLAAATLVVISLRTGLLTGSLRVPLFGAIATLAVANLTYGILGNRSDRADHLLPLQVYGDLAILTVLLHLSGGIENPLSLLMLLHVIIGGIVLSKRHCFTVAAVATLLLGGMALAEGTGWIEHYTFHLFPHEIGTRNEGHAALHPLFGTSTVGLHAGLFFLTAFFVTKLADRLRQDERELELLAGGALAQRQLLERALDTTDTGLRVLDEQCTARWTSSRWAKWFGDGKHAERLDSEGSNARRTLKDGVARMVEIELLSEETAGAVAAPGPAGRVFRITTAPSPEAPGGVGGIVELAQEVTTEKRMQAEMVRAGALAAVGELAGHVAHEVNNPIAIISGKVRLMLSDPDHDIPTRVREDLRKVVELADRVARIAQGLLSSARPWGVTRVPLDLSVPVRKALALVRERAEESGILVETTIPEDLPLVRANPGELEQVFLNLFLNALDAMQGGGRLTITGATESLRDGTEAVLLEVSDTGTGIAPRHRNRVFQPFFSTKDEGRGTGLGLPICRGVVENHGGEIEMASRLGDGTTFAVRLPTADAAGKKDGENG